MHVIDDIKSKLDGLARKDLFASISFFKEGISILYEVFGRTNCGENCAVAAQSIVMGTEEEASLQSPSAGVRTVSFAKDMNNLRCLDAMAKESLCGSKKTIQGSTKESSRSLRQ